MTSKNGILVLSRRPGQSVLIGDLVLTVAGAELACLRCTIEHLNSPVKADLRLESRKPVLLENGARVNYLALREPDGRQALIGLETPPNVRVHRGEIAFALGLLSKS